MEAPMPRRTKPPLAKSPTVEPRKNRVGVGELRQSLSVFLRRVQAGETLEVSERGRAVALLTPLPKSDSVLDRLIAEGRAVDATGDLLELGLPSGKPSRALSQALESTRSDRV